MSVRAVPFNIVHGSGVTAQKFGLEGEGCQLEIYVEKAMGVGDTCQDIGGSVFLPTLILQNQYWHYLLCREPLVVVLTKQAPQKVEILEALLISKITTN